MNRGSAYLDYNATAPVRPEAAAAVAAALQVGGNPSSVHAAGRAARRLVEEAREAVAALLSAQPEQVVFTSGGSEANALALGGVRRCRVLAAAIEHSSVFAAAAAAGLELELVPVHGDGRLDLAALETALRREPRSSAVVSLMLANNETGVLQPVVEAGRLAHAHGALLHCDASQAMGRIPLEFPALEADVVTVSAHKFGGPQGVGAVVLADGLPFDPILSGGQERGRRGGTENVPGIAGFGAVAAVAARELAAPSGLQAMRDDLELRLRRQVPELRIWGAEAPRLPNTSCIGMPGVGSETQVMALDLDGIAVSAGAACSSGKVRPSHVLSAMGASASEAGSAIRVSLGWATTREDIDRLIQAWLKLYARVGTSAADRRPAA